MLTTHLRVVPRLRMSGAVPLLPQYAFMAWMGKILSYLVDFMHSNKKNWSSRKLPHSKHFEVTGPMHVIAYLSVPFTFFREFDT